MSGKGKFEFGADDFGDEPEADVETPAPKKERLGPMAAAARDGGAASRAMRAGPRVSEIEVLELAGEMKALRAAKLDMRLIPLEEIDENHLQRDRQTIDEEALAELKRSIEQNGLGSPIRVDLLEDGRYGLNQGRRRLLAFKQLLAERGEDRFARIPALVDSETERTSAYRRMVDENLIREDVSHAEMAMLAMAYAEESGQSEEDAIALLYGRVHDSKRSNIAAFVRVMKGLGDLLRFPNAIARNVGLELAARIKSQDGLDAVREVLTSHTRDTAESERAAIEAAVKVRKAASSQKGPAVQKFRMLVGPAGKKRVDVSIAGKKLIIGGFTADEVNIEKLRAFISDMAGQKGE